MPSPILLVEDNPHDLEFSLLALEKCGLPNPVEVARDGEEALNYLLRQEQYAQRTPGNPALVLLDLKMPKIDGLEVLKQLRGTPQLAGIPVIVLTHSMQDSDAHRARLLGVERYIVKPIDLPAFNRAVCAAVTEVRKD